MVEEQILAAGTGVISILWNRQFSHFQPSFHTLEVNPGVSVVDRNTNPVDPDVGLSLRLSAPGLMKDPLPV